MTPTNQPFFTLIYQNSGAQFLQYILFAELCFYPAHAKDWLPLPPQPTLFDLITRSTL